MAILTTELLLAKRPNAFKRVWWEGGQFMFRLLEACILSLFIAQNVWGGTLLDRDYILQATLLDASNYPDGSISTRFSTALSGDGNYLVYCLMTDPYFTPSRENFVVYRRDGVTWSLAQLTYLEIDAAGTCAVTISSDASTIVWGLTPDYVGQVRVYRRASSTSNSWTFHSLLSPSAFDVPFSGIVQPSFGRVLSASVDGSVIAVSAPGEGKMRVFSLQGNAYVETTKFGGSQATSDGIAMDMNNDASTIAVQSYYNPGGSSPIDVRLRVYAKNVTGSNWVEQYYVSLGSHTSSSFIENLYFSVALSADGNSMIAGYGENALWSLIRNATTLQWSQQAITIPPTSYAFALGAPVSMSDDGTRVFVASAVRSPYVYVRSPDTGLLTLERTIDQPSPDPTKLFGYIGAISGDGDTVALLSSDGVYVFAIYDTSRPSVAPSRSPSRTPSTSRPSTSPWTSRPSGSPSKVPTTGRPSVAPSTSRPSLQPTTSRPSLQPTTSRPSSKPTVSPSLSPHGPSVSPTTSIPSASPITVQPSASPSLSPTFPQSSAASSATLAIALGAGVAGGIAALALVLFVGLTALKQRGAIGAASNHRSLPLTANCDVQSTRPPMPSEFRVTSPAIQLQPDPFEYEAPPAKPPKPKAIFNSSG